MNNETIEFQGRSIIASSNISSLDYPEDEDCFESDEVLESELLIDLSEEFMATQSHTFMEF